MHVHGSPIEMGTCGRSVITFTICAARCQAAMNKIKYRKFRAITTDIFREDITVFCPEYLESLSVDKLVNHYDFTLVETHAPLHLRIGTNTSWYNDDLQTRKTKA